ncbi:DUF3667 domain-containing protein [Tenacibaculum sp. S7007]|uniref:DUF3667 domain-containing protein n=1 Tax=Tenacibaculum pelagium TaxID=2759527 RepID=A0A839AL88_9FLAO|nr:DUF3667 domain-containing protein [Tenacibaculum pelagium]MBA6155168.1 DUF3667 domain-containing protein [Tenacibaculum pelagium]
MTCISCKTEFNTKFCPNCGEKSEIKKITLKTIFEDAISSITNMDKGFLYNLKTLFLNPKKISTDYILGKRKEILNPISFLILSVSIYLIVEDLLHIPKENTEIHNLPELYIGKIAYAMGKYIHVYLKYFWILSIIPLSISTQLIFRKYNFIEHLAINSFIIAQATIIGIVTFLILRIDLPINPFVYLSILWLVYQVFMTKKDKIETFFMSFAVLVIYILLLIIIGIGIGLIMV